MKTFKALAITIAILATAPSSVAAQMSPFEIERNSRDGCLLIAATIHPDATIDFLGTCKNQRAFGATPASCTASMLALFRRWHDEPTSFAERPNVTVGCIMLLTGMPEAAARLQAKEQ